MSRLPGRPEDAPDPELASRVIAAAGSIGARRGARETLIQIFDKARGCD
jgi:hypothetical protein